jgi:uncharacterized protein HemX
MGHKNLRYYFRKFVIFFLSTIAVSNILAVVWFWNWIKKIEMQEALKFDFSQYLAFQANQNSVLQVYLVIFSLGLGLLGVYGFSQIKHSAEEAARELADETAKMVAEKKAEEVAKKIVESFLSKQEVLDLGKPSFPYNKKEGNRKRKGATDA